MKKLKIFCVLAAVLFSTSCGGGFSKTDYAMGTVISISVYDGAKESVLDSGIKLIKEYEKKLSRNISGSEIDNINKKRTADVSPDTAELIKKGIYYGDISGGMFDITIGNLTSLWGFGEKDEVPDRENIESAVKEVDYKSISLSGNTVSLSGSASLDLGGIAKGYVADKVAEHLKEKGVTSGIINLGGNVLVIGSKGGKPFKVGIQSPFDKSSTICTVSVEDKTVVTSGIYERRFEKDGVEYHHILNPETGYPENNDLASVTVIAENSADADALSTVLFLKGKEQGMKIAADIGIDALFIDREGNITATKGVKYERK